MKPMNPAAFAEHFRATFPSLVGQRVLVALSGGADSVALLHLLRHEGLSLRLEAAHVHHGVRGAEADEDAAFCERLCAGLGVPFRLLRLDPGAALDAGREGTWRRLRYLALLDLRQARGCIAVATGHHQDDVAEGVLVQMLRGGGPRALAGIADATAAGVVRPLLPWGRREILDWLRERGLGWRDDSSNRDPQHLRNRVRHLLLPQLEAASPALRGHLVHLAATLASDERAFAAELAARAQWIDPWEPEGGIPLRAVAELPAAVRWRWLHAQAARLGLERVTRRQGELLEALVATGEPRAVTLGRRWRLRLSRGRLWLEPPETPGPFALELRPGCSLDLPLPGWRIRLAADGDPGEPPRWSFRPPPMARLVVRSARDDDAVRLGGKTVRVRTMLARAMPRHLRPAWPVCCEGDRILWIPGLWQDPEIAAGGRHVVEVMRRERASRAV
jgi:tRNA(Ile)-lysidine synthase